MTEQYILKNLFNKVNKTYMQHWYNGANIEISSRKGFPKLKLVNAYELVQYFLFITWEHLNTILIYIYAHLFWKSLYFLWKELCFFHWKVIGKVKIYEFYMSSKNYPVYILKYKLYYNLKYIGHRSAFTSSNIMQN